MTTQNEAKGIHEGKTFGYVVVARYSYYRKSYFRLIELKREIEKQTGPQMIIIRK
jgi:hypothetical protein